MYIILEIFVHSVLEGFWRMDAVWFKKIERESVLVLDFWRFVVEAWWRNGSVIRCELLKVWRLKMKMEVEGLVMEILKLFGYGGKVVRGERKLLEERENREKIN
jgi:hypothetical protein